MKSRNNKQQCVDVALSAKMWIFREIVNLGLPSERPDTRIMRAESMRAWEQASLAWLDAEQRMRERVDNIVSARIASQGARDIPNGIHYWYWVRLISAQKLTRMIAPRDHSKTIFGVPPSVTKQKMLKWLLISWWADGGIAEWTFIWHDVADELKKRQN